MDDLTTLTDDQLDQMRINVLAEQERRAALATIPGQIADLRERYIAGGGDPADLEMLDSLAEGVVE